MDLRSNRIPERITPDRLTNAVVAITIEDKYSSSYLETKLVSAYNGIHPDLKLDMIKLNLAPTDGIQRFFYANRLFRVLFQRDTIAFNFVTAYPGWETYIGWINDILDDDELVFKKVSLHYISDYKDIAVFSPDVIDGTISFNNIQDFAGTELQYMCHLHDFEDYNTILGDAKVKLINSALFEGIQGSTSRIDIKIESKPFYGNKSILFTRMGQLHKHQKLLFFSMLNEKFVKSLNPEYDGPGV